MIRYEYIQRRFPSSTTQRGQQAVMADMIEELGRAGWDCYYVARCEYSTHDTHFFKRVAEKKRFVVQHVYIDKNTQLSTCAQHFEWAYSGDDPGKRWEAWGNTHYRTTSVTVEPYDETTHGKWKGSEYP